MAYRAVSYMPDQRAASPSASVFTPKTTSSRSRSPSPHLARTFIPKHSTKRTSQACDHCRGRKTKCSGAKPACERCAARGLLCHYPRTRAAVRARARAHSMAGQAVARPATRPMYMEGTGFAHAPKASVIHGPWAPVPEPVKCSRMEAVAGWNWDRDAAGAARDTPYSPSSWSRLSSPSSCRRSTLDLDLTSVELSLFSAAPPYPVVPGSVDGFESDVFKCGPPAGRAGTRIGQDGTELWRYQKEYGGGEGWRETETLERAGTCSLAEMRSTELSGLWTDRDEVEEARWVAVWMGGFGSVERGG